MSHQYQIKLDESRPSANASAGPSNGKRAITSRACDACRTRKLKCSGRPDIIDVNDAGVAVVPCEVSPMLHYSNSGLIGSTARNGSWNAVICINENGGEGGIWSLRSWQSSNELGRMGTGATRLRGVKRVLLGLTGMGMMPTRVRRIRYVHARF